MSYSLFSIVRGKLSRLVENLVPRKGAHHELHGIPIGYIVSEQKKLHKSMVRQYGIVVGDYIMRLDSAEMADLEIESLQTFLTSNPYAEIPDLSRHNRQVQEHVQRLLIQKVFLLDRALLIASVFNVAISYSIVCIFVWYFWGSFALLPVLLVSLIAVLYAIAGYVESRYIKQSMAFCLFSWNEGDLL